MKTIKHILLYSIIGFGFVLGSYSSAQIFGDDEENPVPVGNSFNVVESVNGSNVILDDTVLSNKVGQPMFFWYGQLLNVAITFFPVVLVVSMFWLIYGYLKNLGNKNSLESKKSLDNK